MPSPNAVKNYESNAYYHIFNRGIEKREIFVDDQDYRIFLHYLSSLLSDVAIKRNHRNPVKNFSGEIKLLAYCLMPNHFHVLVYQNGERSIAEFMRCLAVSYVMYFNKKYTRIGALLQRPYKAVSVKSDEQLVHVSRYIHKNPGNDFEKYPYSSFKYYSTGVFPEWMDPSPILGSFEKPDDYVHFCREMYEVASRTDDIIS